MKLKQAIEFTRWCMIAAILLALGSGTMAYIAYTWGKTFYIYMNGCFAVMDLVLARIFYRQHRKLKGLQ